MLKTMSADGTEIAYEKNGSGHAVVLVDGALCYHDSGPGRSIAKLLSQHFTVYLYDRRGRGESANTAPYAVDREIEDLEAIIRVAGGSAYVFGQSSGAVLSLLAAEKLGQKAIPKLAVYEAPIIATNDRSPLGQKELAEMKALIAANRRSDAIKLFFKSVELPGVFSMLLRITPLWPKLMAIAPTLVHDFSITTPYQTGAALPHGLWRHVVMPTWVGTGEKSPLWMQRSARMLTQQLSNATFQVLAGQTHNLKAQGIVPELCKFFGA